MISYRSFDGYITLLIAYFQLFTTARYNSFHALLVNTLQYIWVLKVLSLNALSTFFQLVICFTWNVACCLLGHSFLDDEFSSDMLSCSGVGVKDWSISCSFKNVSFFALNTGRKFRHILLDFLLV